MSDIDRVYLIGPPGCGKTTTGKVLADTLEWDYVGAGDVARRMAKDDQQIEERLDRGGFAPPHRMDAWFRTYHAEQQHPVVIDGFPRYEAQRRLIDEDRSLIVVLDLSIPLVFARLQERGLFDMEREIRRYRLYIEQTLPMILQAFSDSNALRAPVVFLDGRDIPQQLTKLILDTIQVIGGTRERHRIRSN